MKNTSTIVTTCALLCIIMGWNRAGAQDPLEFTGSIFNPVLVHGGPGSYDENLLVGSNITWSDGIFYLYYVGIGMNEQGVCLATSVDGYIFDKSEDNPLLTPSGMGFDSLGAGSGPVVKDGQTWVMYYNARQYPGWGPGESTGRATAQDLTGPWQRSAGPVITVGSPGEWDAALISTTSVLPLDTGGFIMYYYASDDFNNAWLMGMATSPDGITWNKYNDPNTTDPPYAESDPILPAGAAGEFDEWGVVGSGVLRMHGFYHMYYAGLGPGPGGFRTDIGYAYSIDGITWEKWPENPVYVQENDPYFDPSTMIFENNAILVHGAYVYMYYDYGTVENAIGLATAPNIWEGIGDRTTNDGLRMTNYPNPVRQSTVFCYYLDEYTHVKLEVFDGYGNRIAIPADESQTAGEQRILWNARDLPAGIYNYRLTAKGIQETGKLIKL